MALHNIGDSASPDIVDVAASAADRLIRATTALAVLGVAVIAAIVSYEHVHELVRGHGESGWTAWLVPITVDGLIYSSSMVMF